MRWAARRRHLRRTIRLTLDRLVAAPVRGVTLGLIGCAGLALAHAGTAQARERRVVVGQDGRIDLAQAASLLGRDVKAVAARFAASGRIECGGVRGVGQLTGRGDRVTSAAHVFFDEAGRPRADRGRCVFIVEGAGRRDEVALVPDPAASGSTRPYDGPGRHDWGTARLVRPIEGVAPYEIGNPVRVGEKIAVVAFEAGRPTVDFCRVRDVIVAPDGTRELRTDCVGFDGMSGAAYLSLDERPKFLGLHVGFRSVDPDRADDYSELHHTFGAAPGGLLKKPTKSASR